MTIVMPSSFTYPSLPSIAFTVTALLVILHERAKKKNGEAKDDNSSANHFTKEEVLELRQKHFMKAVSISYANSGGLMIMGVSVGVWTKL